MEKKYILTTNTKRSGWHTAYQIKALRDIPEIDVHKGDYGGYVEREENLSHEGTCWVSGEAMACDNSRVQDSAIVTDRAIVKGSTVISGNARIAGKATIQGKAEITDEGHVDGDSIVSGTTVVSEMGYIGGGSQVRDALISGDAKIVDSYFSGRRSSGLMYCNSDYNGILPDQLE